MSLSGGPQIEVQACSYGGKVEKVIEDKEQRLAADGNIVPDEVQDALTATGLDPERAGGLLIELVAALTPKSTEEASDGK